MKSIYHSPAAKRDALALYDAQLQKLDLPFRDLYIDTDFGRPHLVETGDLSGPPLLVFHGGNPTAAYNLLTCRFLAADFHLYAVDIVGHPGKSAETSPPARSYAYGRWASQVVAGLGFERMRCLGGSFGAGVLAKWMCVAPQQVERAVLCVPAGIKNALPLGAAAMMVPLIQYRLTCDPRYVKRAAPYMSITEEALDADTLETVQMSFDCVKTKVGMPSNVSPRRMGRCAAPTLVLAGERDPLFPAHKVLPQAEAILPHCTTRLLADRGHINTLTEGEKGEIVSFLKG